MKRVLLYTATGCGNLGDECILLAEYRLLREFFGDGTEFAVATYFGKEGDLLPEDKNIVRFSYFPNGFFAHPIRNIGYFFRNAYEMVRADAVVIGGGGLFYDTEAGQSFRKQRLEWAIRIRLAKLFRKIICFSAISVDLTPEHLASIVHWFSGPRTIVSVRDQKSAELLTLAGISVSFVPDPVFALESETSSRTPRLRPRVGLAFRSGYLPNEAENVKKIIRHLLVEGYEPILLSHSLTLGGGVTNDLETFRPIADETKISVTETFSETLELYRTLDFLVGMRLHSVILAIRHRIPFFAISYGSKTREMLRDIEASHAMEASGFDFDRFAPELSSVLSSRKDEEFALEEKSGILQSVAVDSYNSLLHGLQILYRKARRNEL